MAFSLHRDDATLALGIGAVILSSFYLPITQIWIPLLVSSSVTVLVFALTLGILSAQKNAQVGKSHKKSRIDDQSEEKDKSPKAKCSDRTSNPGESAKNTDSTDHGDTEITPKVQEPPKISSKKKKNKGKDLSWLRVMKRSNKGQERFIDNSGRGWCFYFAILIALRLKGQKVWNGALARMRTMIHEVSLRANGSLKGICEKALQDDQAHASPEGYLRLFFTSLYLIKSRLRVAPESIQQKIRSLEEALAEKEKEVAQKKQQYDDEVQSYDEHSDKLREKINGLDPKLHRATIREIRQAERQKSVGAINEHQSQYDSLQALETAIDDKIYAFEALYPKERSLSVDELQQKNKDQYLLYKACGRMLGTYGAAMIQRQGQQEAEVNNIKQEAGEIRRNIAKLKDPYNFPGDAEPLQSKFSRKVANILGKRTLPIGLQGDLWGSTEANRDPDSFTLYEASEALGVSVACCYGQSSGGRYRSEKAFPGGDVPTLVIERVPGHFITETTQEEIEGLRCS